jgi:hypothetical protein
MDAHANARLTDDPSEIFTAKNISAIYPGRVQQFKSFLQKNEYRKGIDNFCFLFANSTIFSSR